VDWPEAARKGELWAAGLNVIALAALVFSRRAWRSRGDKTPVVTPPPGPRFGLRNVLFGACLVALVVLAGSLRWKLAHSSLWWDEVWQARNASVGDWKPDKRHPGELKFVPTTWAQALWNYRKPTNHPPMALDSKACHEVWRRATGAAPGEFNEFVLRLPGFIASLTSVAMLALLLRAWGMPVGGLIAAGFLALHPWHIRYGIDCRGYTFLVPLTILGIWAVWRACGPSSGQGHTSSRWWWVLGLTQGLILWCHLLSAWVCAGLAAAGLWWIWSRNSGRERWHKFARFAAMHLVGAMVFLQLFAPNLLQAATWGEKNRDGNILTEEYLGATLAQAAGEMEIPEPTPLTNATWPVQPRWLELWTRLKEGVTPEAALRLVGTFMVAGLILAWFYRRDFFVANTSLAVSCALFLGAVGATEFYFYSRFVLALIVPTVLLIGAAMDLGVRWGMTSWVRGPLSDKGGLIVLALWVLFFFTMPFQFQVVPVIHYLQRTPFAPLRETAAALRHARAQGAAIFGYGFGAEALQYYLPALSYERDMPARPALEAAIHDAQAAGKPLFVALGYEALNRANVPDGFELLDDPAVFTEDSKRDGLEGQFTYRILRSTERAPAR
jgi:Dolichyl-phosphate-mannose-protein mannosyltransferase